MKYFVTFFLLTFYLGLSSQALFEPLAGSDVSQYVKESESFKLQPEVLQNLHKESPKLLTLPIGEVVLNLHQVEIFSPRYTPKRSDMIFYRGSVEGEEGSVAAFSVIGEDVQVMFTRRGIGFHMHRFGKEYILYEDQDIVQLDSFICGVTDEHIIPEIQQQQIVIGNCVEVYFECDFKSYQDNGSSVPNTEAWVAALFNEVATIYDNEDIPVVISDIMVWTTTDPYAGLTSISAILDEFVDQTSTNGYDGRLAHLLSTRNLGGGIAYVNVLCHNTLACAVSTSLSTTIVEFPNYSWNVNVVSHEMGHNFGSQHTHDCVWNGNNTQIDDCGSEAGDVQPCYDEDNPILPDDGTIMSYCHLIGGVGINFSLGFGDQPGALILNKYLTAPCTTGTCPVFPIGIENFELRVEDCDVHLNWVTGESPVLSEGDGVVWQEIPISGDSYVDESPSKFYRLECEGVSRIIANRDLCYDPYEVVGSTLHIYTSGQYQISTVDGKIVVDRFLSGQVDLSPGIWIITFEGKSELVVIL